METAATIRQRLSSGGVALGAWLTQPSPEIAEAMASLGFHWLAIDMEHGVAGFESMVRAIVAAERHGCAPLVRLPSADPYFARRCLDAGAQGVLVPVVEDAEEFAAFASHCLYPPDGRRGVALGRFNRWGDEFDRNFTKFRPLIVPMIETAKGIAATDALAALTPVDALFFGPYDLSANLGVAGQLDHPTVTEAVTTLKQSCDKHGKAAGGHQVPPDPDALAALIADGFQLIAYSTDVIAMRHTLAGGLQQVTD
jgi:2-keto-3-deoxy-L-rhamnonate aldolase RhmA